MRTQQNQLSSNSAPPLTPVVAVASDAGALYSGRRWDTRNNIFRNNLIHTVRAKVPHPWKTSVQAIYLVRPNGFVTPVTTIS